MDYIKQNIIKLFLDVLNLIFRKNISTEQISLFPQKKILLIYFGSNADVLMLTPLIKIISNSYKSEISFLTNTENVEILESNKYVSNIIDIDYQYLTLLKTLKRIIKCKFDILINVSEYKNSKAMFFLSASNAKYKIGFKDFNKNFLTHPIEVLSKVQFHKVDRILELTKAFLIEYNKQNINILFDNKPESDLSVLKFLEDHEINNDFIVCINISQDLSEENWSIQSYESIIKFFQNYDVKIIITSSIYDIEIAEKLVRKNCYTLYNTEVDTYASLIKISDFVFTPYSYTVHLAAVYRKPVFILFSEDKYNEMLKVPYNSDFDFAISNKDSLVNLSSGKVLNSFVPYFEYVYNRYKKKDSD